MILKGWKDIAKYLGCGVRTAQRWEKLGMAVRRPSKGMGAAVVALSEEVDGWLKEAAPADSCEPSTIRVSPRFRYRVLLADNDEALLVTLAARLVDEGYEVRTARDGFEALATMREGAPHVLVADLKMSNMSGFELLSIVRRRFPSTAVIAHSGEFEKIGDAHPLCDGYIEKGANSSFELVEKVRELLSLSPLRSQPPKVQPAPAWIPRTNSGYFVLTCLECLRSFSVMTRKAVIDQDAAAECAHCGVPVSYHIDASVLPIKDAVRELIEHAHDHAASSRSAVASSRDAIKDSMRIIDNRELARRKRG